MTLSDLASLGSFVSSVAVVITLVFLLLQMRQTDRNQRAAIGMGRATRANDLFAMLINPDVTRILTKVYRCDEDLNEIETYTYMYLSAAQLTNYEDTYIHHRAGLLDNDVWETEESIIRFQSSMPSFHAVWPLVRGLYGEEFRRYIENIIAQAVVIRPDAKISSLYNMALREHLARAKPFSIEDFQGGWARGAAPRPGNAPQ
jgi:hypothetical protein